MGHQNYFAAKKTINSCGVFVQHVLSEPLGAFVHRQFLNFKSAIKYSFWDLIPPQLRPIIELDFGAGKLQLVWVIFNLLQARLILSSWSTALFLIYYRKTTKELFKNSWMICLPRSLILAMYLYLPLIILFFIPEVLLYTHSPPYSPLHLTAHHTAHSTTAN